MSQEKLEELVKHFNLVNPFSDSKIHSYLTREDCVLRLEKIMDQKNEAYEHLPEPIIKFHTRKDLQKQFNVVAAKVNKIFGTDYEVPKVGFKQTLFDYALTYGAMLLGFSVINTSPIITPISFILSVFYLSHLANQSPSYNSITSEILLVTENYPLNSFAHEFTHHVTNKVFGKLFQGTSNYFVEGIALKVEELVNESFKGTRYYNSRKDLLSYEYLKESYILLARKVGHKIPKSMNKASTSKYSNSQKYNSFFVGYDNTGPLGYTFISLIEDEFKEHSLNNPASETKKSHEFSFLLDKEAPTLYKKIIRVGTNYDIAFEFDIPDYMDLLMPKRKFPFGRDFKPIF